MVKKAKYSVQYINEKAPEKIRPKTLLVTSLTAMTVALISTQLVGTLSSITWVALASFLTAFVSEGYRVFLEFFHKSVRRQMDSLLTRSSLELDETGEFHIVEQAEATIAHSADEPTYEPITPFGVRKRARGVLQSRWAYTFIFALVGIGTVLGSFAVGSVFQDQNYSVTEVNPLATTTKDISNRRQAEIEENANAVAAEEAAQAEADATEQAEDLVGATRTELLAEIEALTADIKTLDTANEDYEKRIEDLETQISALTILVEELSKAQGQQEETPPTEVTPEETTPQAN